MGGIETRQPVRHLFQDVDGDTYLVVRATAYDALRIRVVNLGRDLDELLKERRRTDDDLTGAEGGAGHREASETVAPSLPARPPIPFDVGEARAFAQRELDKPNTPDDDGSLIYELAKALAEACDAVDEAHKEKHQDFVLARDAVRRQTRLEVVLQMLSDGVTEFCAAEVDAYELICDPNDHAIAVLKDSSPPELPDDWLWVEPDDDERRDDVVYAFPVDHEDPKRTRDHAQCIASKRGPGEWVLFADGAPAETVLAVLARTIQKETADAE